MSSISFINQAISSYSMRPISTQRPILVGQKGVFEVPRGEGTPFNTDRLELSRRPFSSSDGLNLDPTKEVFVEEKSPEASIYETKLSEEEQKEVEELRARDREVRAHEMAHKTTGGPYATGPFYEFTNGPDGKQYATGGKVLIDVSPIKGNPEATIQKMQVVERAALAPAEPSSEDQQVAAQARRTAAEARQELTSERAESAQKAINTSQEEQDSSTFAFMTAESILAGRSFINSIRSSLQPNVGGVSSSSSPTPDFSSFETVKPSQATLKFVFA